MKRFLLAVAAVIALSASAGTSLADILLLNDETVLQVEIHFAGYGGTPATWSDSFTGPVWAGTTFNSEAIEIEQAVDDEFFQTAFASARAEVEGSVLGISHTIWPQARTDHLDTSEITAQPWARADVHLRFLVTSTSNVTVGLAVIAPEGEGGVTLYNETLDSLVYELSGHTTTSHSEELQPGHVYELDLYGEMAGDGLGSASATFYGEIIPETSTINVLLIGLACFVRRRRQA